MSDINNSIRDFEASLQAPVPPPTTDHETAAREQVARLGENPSTAQMTTLMVTMMNKNRHETQYFQEHLSHRLLGTMNTVANHETDIGNLKGEVKNVGDSVAKISSENEDMRARLASVEATTLLSHKIAIENKQRSCKGNFILSGDMIPPPSQNKIFTRFCSQ